MLKINKNNNASDSTNNKQLSKSSNNNFNDPIVRYYNFQKCAFIVVFLDNPISYFLVASNVK